MSECCVCGKRIGLFSSSYQNSYTGKNWHIGCDLKKKLIESEIERNNAIRRQSELKEAKKK